ncbi:hypothetical protein G195_011322 [Phytophthora kernoviae 00238/432]|uniref:Chromo domain-containing protein n=2 Tax=Phytophthora kernoviae TaxID=325452 RepID=A0A8T0LLI4_9STRA|nr:hypothetical protein G195_011322 [Phytophthora kernoviae 00238/432]KAG2506844.1 hypothetical protein JM16_008484 [Phytophthora kernoviae]
MTPATLAAIAGASREDNLRDSQVARKRRPEVTNADLELQGEEYDVWEVKSMLGRKTIDGEYWYLVAWANYDGEPEYVSARDAKGDPDWVGLIDGWYEHKAECLAKGKEPKSLQRYLASGKTFLTLGATTSFDCIYRAVAVTDQLLHSGMDFKAVIPVFKKTLLYSCVKAKGLTKKDINLFFNFLTSASIGWKVHIHKNQYTGLYNGYCGVALCVTEPGVYLVAGIDKKRQGHCFAMKVSKKMEYDAFENDLRVGLADVEIQEILWVRKVTRVEKPAMDAFDGSADEEMRYQANQKAKRLKPNRRLRRKRKKFQTAHVAKQVQKRCSVSSTTPQPWTHKMSSSTVGNCGTDGLDSHDQDLER